MVQSEAARVRQRTGQQRPPPPPPKMHSRSSKQNSTNGEGVLAVLVGLRARDKHWNGMRQNL